MTTMNVHREHSGHPKAPLASVITVNTNERHRLEVYLPAATTSKGDFEIVISDNGSTDGSAELLRQFPEVRVLENGKNLGFAAANNRAAEVARGEILVFLNPDTRVEPDWLEELLVPFSEPTVGLTTSKLLLMSRPDRINTGGNVVHYAGFGMCRGMDRPRETLSEEGEVAAVSGAAFAIRRELFEQMRGFDEDFFIYMEETDLSMRCRLAGWRIVYTPRSIVYHDYAMRFGPKKTLYQERNRYWMLLKNLRWPTLVVLLPSLALAECVSWGFVVTRDRPNWRNKLIAYRSVVESWGDLMRKRREAQNFRRVSDRELLKHTESSLEYQQASDGIAAAMAHVVFDPLFFLLRQATMAIVRW
jgi:GT2 family glycosyltransferase